MTNVKTVQTMYVAAKIISWAIDVAVKLFSVSSIKHSFQIHVKHHQVVLIIISCAKVKLLKNKDSIDRLINVHNKCFVN